jgi:hypothetical protein
VQGGAVVGKRPLIPECGPSADCGPPRRLTHSPNNNVIPSWSHDGRWIYFASDRSGGTKSGRCRETAVKRSR